MGKPVRVQVPPTTPYKIMRLYASIVLYNRSEDAEPQQNVVLFQGFKRERAEAGEFCESQRLKAQLGIAVKRERPRQSRLRQLLIDN